MMGCMNTSVKRTLRHTIARALLPKLFLLALAFAWFAPGYLAPKWDAGSDVEIMQIRPAAEGSPSALLAEHDCWTGEAPADMQGVIPGHVVVTVDGVTRVGGERMVEKALGQMFAGEDHGLRVSGFCR